MHTVTLQQVLDPALGAATRVKALDELVRADSGFLPTFRASALFPHLPWPTDGSTLDGPALTLAACLTDVEQIESALAPGGEVPTVMVGARLALALCQKDASVAPRMLDLLLPHLSDERAAYPGQATTCLGEALSHPHLLILALAHPPSQQDARDRYQQALTDGMDRLLLLGKATVPSPSHVEAFCQVLHQPFHVLAHHAAAAVEDPGRPWQAHLAARELVQTVLGRARAENQETDALQAARQHADRGVEAMLRDPLLPADAREAVESRLWCWMPERVGALQDVGAVKTVEIPRWRDVKDRNKPEVLRTLSVHVRIRDVVDVLTGVESETEERLMTAIKLAGALAWWLPSAAPRLGAALGPVVSTPRSLDWTVKGKPVRFVLAQEALKSFITQLDAVAQSGTPVLRELEGPTVDVLQRSVGAGHHVEELTQAVRSAFPAQTRRAWAPQLQSLAPPPADATALANLVDAINR